MADPTFWLGLRGSIDRKRVACGAGCGSLLTDRPGAMIVAVLRRDGFHEVCGACAYRYSPKLAERGGISTMEDAPSTTEIVGDGTGQAEDVDVTECLIEYPTDTHPSPAGSFEKLLDRQERADLRQRRKLARKSAPSILARG